MAKRRPLDLEPIKQGFSAMAAEYDALAASHPVVIWMRQRIRAIVEGALAPGGSILEINAGSGLDAAYFAAKGYRVHAMDVAPGMLESLSLKAGRPAAGGRLSFEARSSTDLAGVAGAPYDLVFSNLGGLNCIDDLSLVTRHLPAVLRPGGTTVLVLMPPICPWELAQALRGHLRTARRRLTAGGTLANVGGATVPVWYHCAGKLARALGPDFETRSLRSLCSVCPPSFFHGFVRRHPRLTRALMRLDERIGGVWPVSQLGDFYVLVSRQR